MMEYIDIIKDNCENHSAVPWWPKFAFHYTDVNNATSILSCGKLYSRTKAEKLDLMHNDNASRQVIDMTQTEAIACVRFYFRPLTPTQYYTEGFKHSSLRYDNDIYANVPVPIFLLFDLDKLLEMPNVRFSERAQSGCGSSLCSSIQDFKEFDFNKIYSNGFVENFEEVKKYRHAEILFPNSFEIKSCINTILCRNDIERTTLLNLLKIKDMKAYYEYKPIIKTCRNNVFENNGLFVTDCLYHAATISISFSTTYNKNRYTKKMMGHNMVEVLTPVKARLELNWMKSTKICYHNTIESLINYFDASSITYTGLANVPGARTLQIKFFLEDMLMCFTEQSLEEIELIK